MWGDLDAPVSDAGGSYNKIRVPYDDEIFFSITFQKYDNLIEASIFT